MNEMDGMSDDVVAWQGEMLLLGWAESHTKGRTVTFLLPEEGQEHPFKAFTVSKGKRSGQRFAAVFVQIGDDEKPVVKTPAQQAYAMCLSEDFREWVGERSLATIRNEQDARSWMLEYLGIQSRSVLDKGGAVTARFRNEIAEPYEHWRREQYAAL